MTPLERAVGAIESIEAIANSPVRTANAGDRVVAASRVAEVNATVAIAQALARLIELLEDVTDSGRVKVDASGSVNAYTLTP